MFEQEDLKAVSNCLAGDSDAFEPIILRYQKQVMSVAYRIVRDAEDARDIAQGVFIKVFNQLASFDPRRKFFSWLYRIAVNESLNFVEKRKRRIAFPMVQEGTVADPETLFEKGERDIRLGRAMRELSPSQRALLAMNIDGLSYKDIGETMGLPEKKVKSRLFEARHRLREILVREGWVRHA